ncbi:hypothetical protein K474DRAFT_1769425 [Panus rudis PR-1116 ss-1]|nr:hypothetical protein K474DRAFT_1769425 [Panus rudis PR-1116 ss-1]
MSGPPGGPLPPDVQNAINTGFSHLIANKYYVLASTVMLVYDHMLTFEREYEYVWKQRTSIPTVLFFIFRYMTPIVSLINLVALNSPHWTGSTCTNWIWLPVAMGPIINATAGIILILRVHAIYGRSKWVLAIMIPVYCAQLAVQGWSIPAGVPAPLPPGFVGCVPSSKEGTGKRLSSLYIAALVFDATIFILTLARAIFLRLKQNNVPLMTLIVRDGTLYFLVLFFVNLVNVFLLSLAPADLSAINAPFASMITCVLVARLVFNLRAAARRGVVLSKRADGTVETVSTWRPADRTGYSAGASSSRPTGSTSIATPPDYAGHSRSFISHDFMGLDDFDVPLDYSYSSQNSGLSSRSAYSQSSADSEYYRENIEDYEMDPKGKGYAVDTDGDLPHAV